MRRCVRATVLLVRAIGLGAVVLWRFAIYRPGVDVDNRDRLADADHEYEDRGEWMGDAASQAAQSFLPLERN